MHDKLSVLGANLLKETLPSIVNGTMIVFHKMTHKQHSLQILAEDERIDWTMNAKDIHNHIRGLSPWPVGYTTMDINLYSIYLDKEKYMQSLPSINAVNIAKHRGGPHNGNVVNAILRTIFRMCQV